MPATATQETAGKVFRKDVYFDRTGYIPHLGQQEVHWNSTRHRVLCNGRRWGKTLLGAKEVETMAFIRNFLGESNRGWIIGPEYTDCEKEFRVVFDTFKKLGIDQVSPKFLNNTENGNMHIQTSWGFDVECRSARHPESLVGEGLDFVLLVEGGRHKRSTWGQYVRPALSDKRGWSLTSGVPEGSSETSLLFSLWQRGQDVTKKTWASWRMPSWTNNIVFPGGRQDPEILEAEDDLTEEEFDRQYGALFVEKVGRVMKEWDDEVHLVDVQYRRELPLYLAVDYGYTNDWVALWIQVDRFNNVYVIREDRWKLRDTDDIARRAILEHPVLGPLSKQVVAIYPDPAAPDDTAILSRVLKKPARSNTGGEIKTRLNLIRTALKLQNSHLPDGHPDKRPTLMVDRSCTKLAWEMREGYRWPEHKSETRNDSENPMDKDNHGPEALGRFFKGHFGSPVTEARRARQGKVRLKR